VTSPERQSSPIAERTEASDDWADNPIDGEYPPDCVTARDRYNYDCAEEATWD
jgi:hypothetical protein